MKDAQLTNIDTFTMLNTESKEKFIFKIHNKQKGGDGEEEIVDLADSVIGIADETKKSGDIIKKLQSKVESIDSRIKTLEMMISSSGQQIGKNINATEIIADDMDHDMKCADKNDTCVIQ